MPRLTWDPPKRRANLDKHGFDFEEVYDFDWATAAVSAGHPDRSGKPRWKAVGRWRDSVMVVIYASLGEEAIAVISFRPAKVKERIAFHGKP